MTAGDEPGVDRTLFLGGRLTLHQPREGHRVGTDAALAIAAARPYARRHAVDFGAGVGAIGLSLAALIPAIRVTLVEIDPALAALASRNAATNGLAERATVVAGDVRDRMLPGVASASADLAVMNPPFLDAPRIQSSPDRGRAVAHVMERGDLGLWLAAASTALASRGALVLIHRPEALPELLAGLGRDFGSIALRLVHPRADQPASRILVFAKKGGRAALSVKPPLIVHDGPRFAPLAEAIHQGEAELPFD